MYEHQKQISREVNEHIPRGPDGSPQNWLRFGFMFYRSQHQSFESSLALALERVRETHPDFVPVLR